MSQHERSAAESAAIRASHSALLNHAIKAESGIDPFSTLPKWDSSSSTKLAPFKWPAFMVRDLFNHLKLVDLARDADYDVYLQARGTNVLSNLSNVSPEARSTILRFVAKDGEVAFLVHAYITTDLQIEGHHRMLDPKSIILQNRTDICPSVSGIDVDGIL